MSGLANLNLFGLNYTFQLSYVSYGRDSQSNPFPTYWTDSYETSGGGLNINYYQAAGNAQPSQRITGNDPFLGSFSTDFTGGINNLVWQARTAPSFIDATLYLNGTLMNWQAGAIDTSGVVTDTYGPDSSGRTLVLKGSVRDFMQNAGSADVSINGASVGSCTLNAPFNIAGWDVEVSAPNRETPFFTLATLWVDGTPYAFSNGYGDASGNRKDVYLTSGGTVSISGNTASASNANVQVNHGGEIHTGTANFQKGGSFTVEGVAVSAIAPDTGPPAFWVGDVFYRRTAGTNQYTSFPTAGNSLILDGTDPTAMRISGTQGGHSIGGTFVPTAGVFLVSLQNSPNPLPVCPARADGSQIPSGYNPPSNALAFPPAVHVGTEVWDFLGATTDDGAPARMAAYYGNARNAVYTTDPTAAPLTADDHRRLLKINITPSDLSVTTLTDYRTGSSATGILMFNGQFQTGVANSLPMPMYCVDPNANDTFWRLDSGALTASNGPATLLVGNQVWRFAYQDGGTATYYGYYDGQQLALSTPNAGGVRTITVTDPVNGNATGMLNDVNGSTTLSNGQTINSGTLTGAQVQPQNLATVGGDLGLSGNIISIGSLNGDSTTAGATLQFSDTGTQAMLGTALGRSAAQWVWWRVDPANAAGFVPTMVVDSAFGLVLYDPANPSTATVKLNPSTSTASELPKLKLTNQTLDESGSVVTQALGDDRYVRVAGANQSLALTSGINVNTGTSGSTNTVPADAAAIGQNLQAGSGQVVVGRNNTAANDEIFVVGAGASPAETKNALSVSTSGNTTIAGSLAVSENVAITGALTVAGSPVLTQGSGASAYLNTAQLNAIYLKAADAASLFLPVTANKTAIGTTLVGAQGVGIGQDAIAGPNAVSVGMLAGSNGNAENVASGMYSVSVGQQARAQGLSSVAVGNAALAEGENSIALGNGSATIQRGGIAIGEFAQSFQVGQVVLGSFNLADDSLFILGNGTADDARSNAFVIKRNGDTQVFGTLTVGGQPVLTQDAADARYIQTSQIGGGGNSAILTQDAADTRYLQKGQPIRVAPAGDIDMGEFQATPPGVTAP